MGVAPAEAEHALARDGVLDEGRAPRRVPEARRPGAERPQVVEIDEADPTGRDRADAGVRGAQMKARQVGQIPRDMQGDDLPPAVRPCA
ncbi:MAG TPA: hypothetical protein VEA41_08300 [Salinarimonas sp.]|nr:hypothetical protein [Salinarimonas sp.]